MIAYIFEISALNKLLIDWVDISQSSEQNTLDQIKMIKLKDLLSESKFQMKGKYLYMPTGEMSSIPGTYEPDSIIVSVKRDEFKIPKNISLKDAASIPECYFTVWSNLVIKGKSAKNICENQIQYNT